MLDVLIGSNKLTSNLIAPTNSPARSYSAFSPARSSPARAAHAGLFNRAASAHSTPAPTGLCSPSRRPPFAASAPASTAAWRPRFLASVRRCTASVRASLPRLRLPSHGLARASPPSRPRQLLLAGCTVGYRACPFAYLSSRVNKTVGNRSGLTGYRSNRSGPVTVSAGTQPAQIQNSNLNSKNKKFSKKFLKILQGATNLMVSNFLKNSFI